MAGSKARSEEGVRGNGANIHDGFRRGLNPLSPVPGVKLRLACQGPNRCKRCCAASVYVAQALAPMTACRLEVLRSNYHPPHAKITALLAKLSRGLETPAGDVTHGDSAQGLPDAHQH